VLQYLSSYFFVAPNSFYSVNQGAITRNFATPTTALSSTNTDLWVSAMFTLDSSSSAGQYIDLIDTSANHNDLQLGFPVTTQYRMDVANHSGVWMGVSTPAVGTTQLMVWDIHYNSSLNYTINLYIDPDPA
jgi:hypothetical protein